MEQLSTREKEILNMVITGMKTVKIAESLGISKRTVDAHRRNIIRKSGTPGLIGLYLYAIKNKYINPDKTITI